MDFTHKCLCFLLILKPVTLRSDGNASLASFVDEYWNWRLEQSPEFATKVASPLFQDRLQQLTEQAFLTDKNTAQELLARSAVFQYKHLEPQDKIVLKIIQTNLEKFINGYKYRKYTQYNPIAPMGYPSRDWGIIISLAKLQNATDFENLIARYRAISIQIEQMMVMMRIAIANKTTLHATSLTGENERYDTLLATIANRTSFFHSPFYMMPEVIPINQRATLRHTAFEVIETIISPAISRFRTFLKEEYLPQTRPEPGLSSLLGGAEVYEQCLTWHLDVPLTPKEVHQMGLAEVDRIHTLMTKIKEQDGFLGTLAEYLADIKSKPENYYATEAEMLDGYRDIIAKAHGKLHKVLMDVPDDCPVVVQQNMNPQGWARYSAPSRDGSKPGAFIINVFNPETRPKFAMTALTLHEAEPGHHTMACGKMNKNSEIFEKLQVEYRKYYAVPFNFPFFTSSSEGWALYAESMGEEMGIYTEPHSLLGKYTSEIFRAARLVVDTGIHAFGWSRSRAVEYLYNHTTRSLNDIENEVNRYISWPGQACSYKVGELKLQELRVYAKNKLGPDFDIRKFNQELINYGILPITMVQELMYDWIDRQVVSAAPALWPFSPILALTTLTMIHVFFD